MRVETKIIENLLYNEDYCRKVVPHIKSEYFADKQEKLIVENILKFFNTYNTTIEKSVLKLELNNENVNDNEIKELYAKVDGYSAEKTNTDWLFKTTEEFCKYRSVYNAILTSIKIIEGKDKESTVNALPKIMQDALSVSFDSNIGHDYINDAEARYDFYNRKEEKVSFGIELLDKVTSGGMSKKSLSIVLAPTNVGKSLIMCNIAAKNIANGNDVLYITAEMAEEKIAERIDANLLDISLKDLAKIDKNSYIDRFAKLVRKTQGKLIIKEYPPGSAHAGHFRALLEDLRIKKNFMPKLLIVDYLNICASSRVKGNGASNTYLLVKSIAEELRGLGVEYNIPVLSATQTVKSGYNNSDIDLSHTSESYGLNSTADFIFAAIRTDELDELNQMLFKQLKSRFGDVNYYKKFVVGVDITKMKIYDLEQCAQKDISESKIPESDTSQNRFDGFKF